MKGGKQKMQIKECILIEPYTCEEGDTVIEVSRKLRQTTLRHIFVVDKEMRPVGIISVIDINIFCYHFVFTANKI